MPHPTMTNRRLQAATGLTDREYRDESDRLSDGYYPDGGEPNSETVTHGREEGFCPRCYDFRLFRVETKYPEGVTGAFCMGCEWATVPEDIPHDAPDAEERFPDEV